MSLLEHSPDAPSAWSGTLPVTNRYTLGLAGERFFRAFKDEGRIYGTYCQECDVTYVPATATQPGFSLGSRNGSTANPSYLQDVAIYTRALTQAEIQNHYQPDLSGYAAWAATHAPTGGVNGDYDGDGVPNGVEYVLGGSKDTNDTGKLPMSSINGDDMLFTFVRDQASIDGTTTVQIETSTDLATWNIAPSPYAVPDGAASNNPGVSVVKDSPSAGKDTVTLRIPRAPDAKKFAHLKVTVP